MNPIYLRYILRLDSFKSSSLCDLDYSIDPLLIKERRVGVSMLF